MIIKTSELEGAALDCAVAESNGWNGRIAISSGGIAHCYIPGPNVHGGKEYIRGRVEKNLFGRVKPDSLKAIGYVYSPSTDWAQGGTLLDRYDIALNSGVDSDGKRVIYATLRSVPKDAAYACGTGETCLIAAMRAIVAAQLGDEVDVPNELGGDDE
ncbi:DUF2591 domain-containing protein [Halomonas cupida]|uniref:phage protein NinX family protein n=1 Tax=Halomonas cupida TaxID=44933 RepID=UPI0039B43E35